MPRHILIKLTKTKHKERILKAAKEKQQVIYKGNLIGLTADLSAKTLQAGREWQDIFKALNGKNTTKITIPSKDFIQNWWRNKKLFRQAKVKRIQYHQTGFTTNVKGTSIVKGGEDLQNQFQIIKKMAIGTYISIIILNVSGLNVPTKKQTGWMDTKSRPIYMLSTRNPLKT